MAEATEKQLPLKDEVANLHWSFWLGVTFFVAVIVAILLFGIFLNKRLSAEESAPVTSIAIAGEMPYTCLLYTSDAADE